MRLRYVHEEAAVLPGRRAAMSAVKYCLYELFYICIVCSAGLLLYHLTQYLLMYSHL